MKALSLQPKNAYYKENVLVTKKAQYNADPKR